jgi:hypothetical protein
MESRYGTRSMIFTAAVGMVIDVACSSLGIAESSTASRLVTGGAFGLLTAFVLTPILHELIESFGHGPQ